MKKLCALILTILAVLIMHLNKVSAQELQNEIKINIQQDLSSDLEINFNLKDSTNINYLTGFELTIPFEIINNEVAAKLDGTDLHLETSVTDNKTTIKLSTESINADLSSDTWLNLKFKVKDLVKEKYDVNYLYFPIINNNFNLENIKYDVSYPEKLSEISFPQSVTQVNNHEVTLNTNKSLFIIWGNTIAFNIKSSYTLKNVTDNNSAFLVGLPSNIGQDVSYNQFPGVEGGIYDILSNNFGVKNINANNGASILMEAAVEVKKDSLPIKIEAPKYNWNLDTESIFSKNLIEKLKPATIFKDQVSVINNYLIDNLTPYVNEKYDLGSLNSIWSKLSGSSQFNSFEYCYLAVSAAEYLGYKGNIQYGYTLLPDFLLSQKRSPHVWCELTNGTESYFIDPFLEDQFKLNYQFTKPLDRVTFGTWIPSMEYNNILGLLSNSSEEVQTEFSEYSINQSQPALEITLTPSTTDLYSGEYYQAQINIINNSKYFIELKDINIDNLSYISSLKVRDFYPALIPGKETSFTLSNLIQPAILYNGNKQVNISLDIDYENINEENLNKSTELFFKISLSVILKDLILVGALGLLIYIIYKFFVYNRISKYLKSLRSSKI